MNSVRMSGISGDQKLTADGIRGLAVKALSRLPTWGLNVESLRVAGSRHISGALHGTVEIVTYLIQSNDKYNLPRPLCNAGNTIGISIDIDHDTVACDGIRA